MFNIQQRIVNYDDIKQWWALTACCPRTRRFYGPKGLLLAACCLLPCVSAMAEEVKDEFEWSALEDVAPLGDVPAMEEIEPAVAVEEFDWSFGGDEQSAKSEELSHAENAEVGQKESSEPVQPAQGEQVPVVSNQGTVDGGRDGVSPSVEQESSVTLAPLRENSQVSEPQVSDLTVQASDPAAAYPLPLASSSSDTTAYGELLKENLALRRKIADVSKDSEEARMENERLVKAVKQLESSIGQMTSRIEGIKQEQASTADNLDKVMDLERQLTQAEREKKNLVQELDVARRQAEASSDLASKQNEKAMEIQQGSDLFKKIEQENTLLKNKLVDIETERQKAVKAKAALEKRGEKVEREIKLSEQKQKELEQALEVSRSAEKEHKQLVEKILKEVPTLESELVKLNAEVVEKEALMSSQEKNIELLKNELEKREHRFVKAERMAELLEQARAEVRQVSNVEKRDMHYNMAVIYAKEGKVLDAEREYLKALKMDPNDPEVHYNLGVLYDDELNDKRKAALHYHKYLQLAPFAGDIDQVKQWLLNIELGR